MSSMALERWRGERGAVLDELQQAHHAVGGHERGRRTQTQSINEALLLRLAAEFQGFCRELHAEGVEAFRTRLAVSNAAVATVVSGVLSRNLKLDRGNAGPGELGEDFLRFGLDLWPALRAADSRTAQRHGALDGLMFARNAVVHADTKKLADLERQGVKLNLEMFRRGRSKLNALAGTMDRVVGRHIGQLFDEPPARWREGKASCDEAPCSG